MIEAYLAAHETIMCEAKESVDSATVQRLTEDGQSPKASRALEEQELGTSGGAYQARLSLSIGLRQTSAAQQITASLHT